jgi:hypothetical protein
VILAGYLANRPTGAPLVYLIVAATLLVLAGVLAGWTRDAYRALLAIGLALVVVALLTH